MVTSWLRGVADDVADESFRTAVLVGLASVPFTVVLSWELVFDEVQVAGGSVSGIPLVGAGLVVGSLYRTRPAESSRAGIVVGFAASVGVAILYVLNTLTTVVSASTGVAVVVVLATPVVVALGAVLCAFVGMLSAMLGEWAARQGSRVFASGVPNRK